MKVILQREVDKLGSPGDVVEVADGYARNYLIPRGLVLPATKGGQRHADRLRQAHRGRMAKAMADARTVAQKLSAVPIRVAARAGEDGRLFGSVTVPHLVEEVERATGVKLDRKHVHLDDPIRSVGRHEVQVHLLAEVDATLTVEVVAQ